MASVFPSRVACSSLAACRPGPGWALPAAPQRGSQRTAATARRLRLAASEIESIPPYTRSVSARQHRHVSDQDLETLLHLLDNLVRVGTHGNSPERSRQMALPDYHPGCNGFQLSALAGSLSRRSPTGFGHTLIKAVPQTSQRWSARPAALRHKKSAGISDSRAPGRVRSAIRVRVGVCQPVSSVSCETGIPQSPVRHSLEVFHHFIK
jgi:hypothetical protein